MTKAQLLDLLERSVWTFLQTFVAVFVASGVLDSTNLDGAALKAAAIAAGLAALKAVIAQQFGTGTAATLPARDEPVLPADADYFGDGEH
jgi:hypothetical protein